MALESGHIRSGGFINSSVELTQHIEQHYHISLCTMCMTHNLKSEHINTLKKGFIELCGREKS